jgi:putative effector of murein hydrolase
VTRRSPIAWVGLAITLAFFGYAAWMTRNGPTSELTPFGATLLYATIGVGLVVMVQASLRAYHAGNRWWAAFCLFFWPAAYVYALAIDRTDA